MPYTREFFQEKLNLTVEYFNPFRNIEIDPGVNLEELAKVAHAYGEVVGLGLRNPTQCPVELNLIPKSILKRQELNQKKPYFIAAAASLIIVVFIFGWFFDKLAKEKQGAIDARAPKVEGLRMKKQALDTAISSKVKTGGRGKAGGVKVAKNADEAEQYAEWMSERFRWADIMTALDQALRNTENRTRRPNMRTAVWIEKMAAENAEVPEAEAQEEEENRPRPMMDIRMLMRYGLLPRGLKLTTEGGEKMDLASALASAQRGSSETQTKQATTNEISVINLTCRGLSWNKLFATADNELAYTLLRELEANSQFMAGTNGTQLAGQMEQDETTSTFKFDVKLKLAKPIKF